MNSSRIRTIAAVEVGTSKVAVLVGQRSGRVLDIVGFGECESHGVVKGVVVDYKQAATAVATAIEEAQRTSRVRIDEVHLAVSGGHLEGFFNDAAVNVSSSSNQVSPIDIENVIALAKSRELPPDRVVVHFLRRPFRLDGRVVGDPDMLDGRRLELGYWILHGHEPLVASLEKVINGCHLEVAELAASGLASGLVVTTPEERRQGVLAIDIGCGTTDYVLYRDGAPHVAGVLAVGGQHISNDLALGLRITLGDADALKMRHGRAAVQARDTKDKVWLKGDYGIGDRELPRRTIEQICTLRVEEIFEVVQKKLGREFSPELAPAGVVLTGGTARLPGIAECATRVLGVPARLGAPGAAFTSNEDLRDPAYSTVFGVLYYCLAAQMEHTESRRATGVFSALKKIFAA